MFPVIIILAGFIAYVTYRTKKTPIPHTYWKRFHEKGTVPLDAQTCNALQGIYIIAEGKDLLGETAILKWSYTVEGKQTLYHLSLFCQKDGSYIVCEGRRNGNDILLDGYWRQLTASKTGTIRLIISQKNGPIDLSDQNENGIVIKGLYGDKNKIPDQPVAFHYHQTIPKKNKLQIIAHRGGGRNVDFLPVSENSIDMFKMAARLGATGVEIDVRLTKDNVPVIIHDRFLSIHTVKESLYGGLVHNYTLAQLKKQELRKGGIVPTLNETLHTILYNTPLNLVWLDIKKECDLTEVRNLQMTYLQKAKEIGRDLEIYIGIPDKKILGCFTKLPDYQQLPSLTELDSPVADEINANVWAPQYTGGFQQDEVQQMQAQGRKVFVWSLDDPSMIELYIKEGGFDGIVTNVSPVAFHTYYTHQEITAGN